MCLKVNAYSIKIGKEYNPSKTAPIGVKTSNTVTAQVTHCVTTDKWQKSGRGAIVPKIKEQRVQNGKKKKTGIPPPVAFPSPAAFAVASPAVRAEPYVGREPTRAEKGKANYARETPTEATIKKREGGRGGLAGIGGSEEARRSRDAPNLPIASSSSLRRRRFALPPSLSFSPDGPARQFHHPPAQVRASPLTSPPDSWIWWGGFRFASSPDLVAAGFGGVIPAGFRGLVVGRAGPGAFAARFCGVSPPVCGGLGFCCAANVWGFL